MGEESGYDLELDRAASEIKKQKAKKVCIQLPDGLKSRAKDIADHLQKETGAGIIIWAGSCFGACDPALESEAAGAELLIQGGHSE